MEKSCNFVLIFNHNFLLPELPEDRLSRLLQVSSTNLNQVLVLFLHSYYRFVTTLSLTL